MYTRKKPMNSPASMAFGYIVGAIGAIAFIATRPTILQKVLFGVGLLGIIALFIYIRVKRDRNKRRVG